jgi:predicted ribosome quality control (RQC) complex YloA/Tae2 family protein
MTSSDVAGAIIDRDGLRKEAQRMLYRAQKKANKANDRANACETKQEALLTADDPSLEELEALPDCTALRADAAAEAERASQLQQLVDGLQAAAKDGYADQPRVAELVGLASSLEVADKPPTRPPPKPRKVKGPRTQAPRLPYRVYRSAGDVEIRVGKGAADNDKLSTEPQHRDGDDWWLHASGCPGSHVVIRSETLGVSELSREVELDAAVLAANYSKAAKTGTIGVNLCRARQVSKPMGAKPGLVQLSGDVKTIKLNWQKERKRLERLADSLAS